MKKIYFLMLFLFTVSVSYGQEIIVKKSKYPAVETTERLKKAIESKGLKIFMEIDHQKAAQKVGMDLNYEKVIMFGNPKLGTLLMKKNPLIGLDLPLKILVWQNKEKETFVSYLSPETLKNRYKVSGVNLIFNKMKNVLAYITDYATK